MGLEGREDQGTVYPIPISLVISSKGVAQVRGGEREDITADSGELPTPRFLPLSGEHRSCDPHPPSDAIPFPHPPLPKKKKRRAKEKKKAVSFVTRSSTPPDQPTPSTNTSGTKQQSTICILPLLSNPMRGRFINAFRGGNELTFSSP